jgi:Fur family ferric uptake transcriptional regulator
MIVDPESWMDIRRFRALGDAGVSIAEIARETGHDWKTQELHADLRRGGGGVGLTTVYRHLQALADAGAVDVLRTPEGESVYRICGTGDHHHHLVCRRCGRTVEIEGREVERWTRRVAETEGFVDVDHTVEVFGTCAACAAR